MDVNCPHCNQLLTLKISKPGRFAPVCPTCQKKLLITVPSDPSGAITVERPQTEIVTRADHPKQVVSPPGNRPQETEATHDFATSSPNLSQGSAAASPAASGTRAGASSEANAAGARTSAAAGSDATLTQTEMPPASAAARAPAAADIDIPETLAGYHILKRLGQGAMGAVYLAKQLSLNRSVALKTIRPEVARNPVAVARFTREAYAAAQLVHHNVVQIYDMAADHGVNFFSMEFVTGQNLADLVRRRKKLPPSEAAGLILQAARGLRFAHLNGMVHRDVKPANLMLNDQGVVKVADLGLVKMAAGPAEPKGTGAAAPESVIDSGPITSEVTLARTTMGTAAYIAPEQITDAHNVDQRADIYSLGCTFFVLMTGRPPFEGKNVLEVIKRHQFEPVPRPDDVDPDVPVELGDIVAKMTAKKPQDRYATLDDTIKNLEEFLARGDGGTLKPRSEHVEEMKLGLEAFNGSSWRAIRRLVGPLFYAVCVLLLLAAIFTGRWVTAGGVVAYAVATFGSYLVLRGLLEDDYLFNRFRALLHQSTWSQRVTWGIGVCVLLIAMLMMRLLVAFLFAVVLGIGAAVAFYAVVDRLLAAQRVEALDRVRKVLMDLRARGVDEEEIRKLVIDNCQSDWEEFIESLFGYELKMAVRRQRTEAGEDTGRSYAFWRDPLIRWADQRLERHQQQRERRHLQELEQKSLESEGVGQDEARRRASHSANTLVSQAMELRELMASATPGDRKLAKRQQDLFRNLLKAAQTGDVAERERSRLAPVAGILDFLFGQGLRLLLGGIVVALCAMWLQKNGFSPTSVEEAKQQAGLQNLNDTQELAGKYAPIFGAAAKVAVDQKKTQSLTIPVFPERVNKGLNGISLGAGALILLIGSLMTGRWVGPFVFAAAIVALFGTTLGLPILISVRGYDVTAAMVGFALLMAGGILGGKPSEDYY